MPMVFFISKERRFKVAVTKLFDTWQVEGQLPEPFQEEIKKAGGVKYTTNEAFCSMHNHLSRGRKATLYPAVLQAILQLLRAEEGENCIAAGIQLEKEGETTFFCLEYEKQEGRCYIAYNPKNGRFSEGIFMQPGLTRALPEVSQSGSHGEEFLALFAYASLEDKGNLYDQEFHDYYEALKDQYRCGWSDRDKTLHVAFVLCDNLYRRIENGESLKEAGIPFDKDAFERGAIEHLTYTVVQSGIYSPNEKGIGEFLVFEQLERRIEYEIGEMQKKYGRGEKLPTHLERLVPKLPSSYKVGPDAVKILNIIQKTPLRTFLITGSAGVGKSTDAKILARVLGVPYYFFTCGPNTDEMEMIASMVPNTGKRAEDDMAYPFFDDMLMDPASALQEISGVYENGIDAEAAFQKILSAVYERGYRMAKQEKDFTLVESPIIKGCKQPSVIEIQEPTLMERPATMARLNALLDDTAAIELLNGEVIYRHPETVIVMTTNLNYIGCKMFNESVLSRIGMVQHREDMNVNQMVARAMRKTGFKDIALLKKMADIALQIREHIKAEDIRGGVCEYREYEDWVWAYQVEHDICESAQNTIVGKASMEPSERDEIMDIYVKPHFMTAA